MTAIGIGVGGLVAYAALARDSHIDDLVLWAVPARGRVLARELGAFSALEQSPFSGDAETGAFRASDGSLAVAGFVLTAETIASLDKLDLTKIELPCASARRVLLLERDGLAPDARLREHLLQSGVDVAIAAGDGYGAMMADPRLARPPRVVFTRTIKWLADAPHATRRDQTDRASSSPRTIAARDSLDFGGDGEPTVRETPLSLTLPSGRLFGVLTEPVGRKSQDVCAVLLNAASIRRIGPNRMWVEVARRWAVRGVPTVRIDLRALGDSDGDERRYTSVAEYYRPELTEQALATLDEFEARALPNRFVLTGLCSGAYWSFGAALADERVVGAFMINPWTLFWSDAVAAERNLSDARFLLSRRGAPRSTDLADPLPDPRSVLLAGSRVLRTSVRRRSGRAARSRDIDLALDRLRDRSTEVLLQFAGGEPLYDDLVRDGQIDRLDRWPNLHLDRIPGEDHSVRALVQQRHVHAVLDEALERVLRTRL